MRIVFLFFLFIPLAIAVPSTSSSSSSSFIHSISSSSSRTSNTTRIPLAHPTTHPYSIQIISPLTLPTHTRNLSTINPVHTRTSGPRPTDRSRANRKPINIAFEVLGGVLVTGMLLGFLRCFHNYRKTPRRDRIADILHRHHLQRELEELERNPAALRRPSLREPAPPYFPRPPSYEQMNSIHQGTPLPQTDYSAVPTYSPPPSPPMSQRSPLTTRAVVARPLPDLMPPMQSG